MTFPTDQDELNVCRHLGLADDQESHATYATDAHRCFKLDTPTKIATQHQERFCLGPDHPNCPIFKGEGLARSGRTAAASAGATVAAGSPLDRASRAGGEAESVGKPVRAPRAPQRPTPDRPFKVGNGPGLSPRPRAGGISMRTMTIGLFILAAVVLALAFLIQNVVGGDDGPSLASTNATQTALAPKTATASGTRTVAAGTSSATAANSATATAQANRTPTGSATTGTSTAPAAGTYTVKAGDNCSSIADGNGVTVDQLRQLNPTIDAGCSNLQPGQVLKLK